MELSSQRGLRNYNAEPLTPGIYSVQYCILATTREMRDCLPYNTDGYGG